MKRLFDLSAAIIAALCFSPLILIIALSVKLTSPGPILYWSNRMGKNNEIFKMPKFPSMLVAAPAVPTGV